MRGLAFDAAKRRITRALALAGVALTVAGAALPAQASAHNGGGATGHRVGGGATGHRVG